MKTLQDKAFQISDRTYDECPIPVDIMMEAPLTMDDYNYFVGGGDDCVDVDLDGYSYE